MADFGKRFVDAIFEDPTVGTIYSIAVLILMRSFAHVLIMAFVACKTLQFAAKAWNGPPLAAAPVAIS
jgi:hypothetical protein